MATTNPGPVRQTDKSCLPCEEVLRGGEMYLTASPSLWFPRGCQAFGEGAVFQSFYFDLPRIESCHHASFQLARPIGLPWCRCSIAVGSALHRTREKKRIASGLGEAQCLGSKSYFANAYRPCSEKFRKGSGLAFGGVSSRVGEIRPTLVGEGGSGGFCTKV